MQGKSRFKDHVVAVLLLDDTGGLNVPNLGSLICRRGQDARAVGRPRKSKDTTSVSMLCSGQLFDLVSRLGVIKEDLVDNDNYLVSSQSITDTCEIYNSPLRHDVTFPSDPTEANMSPLVLNLTS
jgi:hypothetical protein